MADPQRPLLEFMATEIDQMAGRYSPGREVYYALMRARRAVQEAARQVAAEDERVWPVARCCPSWERWAIEGVSLPETSRPALRPERLYDLLPTVGTRGDAAGSVSVTVEVRPPIGWVLAQTSAGRAGDGDGGWRRAEEGCRESFIGAARGFDEQSFSVRLKVTLRAHHLHPRSIGRTDVQHGALNLPVSAPLTAVAKHMDNMLADQLQATEILSLDHTD